MPAHRLNSSVIHLFHKLREKKSGCVTPQEGHARILAEIEHLIVKKPTGSETTSNLATLVMTDRAFFSTNFFTASLLLFKDNGEKKKTVFPNTMTTKHMTQTPVSCV